MREDWKPVAGFSDYEINSEGVIVSLLYGKRRVLKPNRTKSGYLHIRMRKNGITHTKKVHRLVWESFKGDIPDDMFVLHGEGNVRDNCCLEYLSLGTHKDNMQDKLRDGTDNIGEKHWKAKLTEVQVKYIKARLADGMFQRSLALLFGVARITISDIARGKLWSHV